MKIQSNSIILAPSSLHLAIYQQILKQKNNCMNIQVISISTYIKSFARINHKNTISIIYEYRERLQNLSLNNAYRSSIEDIQFLNACHSFICWMKLYNQRPEDLLENTYKEKDIKEVISLIFDIVVFEDNTNTIIDTLPELDHIYILDKEMNKKENFWVKQLINKGAHLLQENEVPSIGYYSVANNKKQAELVSKIIIEENLDADEIFISCNNDNEKYVLSQIFELYKIPYTFLSQRTVSSVSREWISCLNWVSKKDLPSFLTLIETLYKKDYKDIQTYYSLFPEQFNAPDAHLSTLDYVKNNLISESEFEELKSLEAFVTKWIDEHRYLYEWKYNDFESIANTIQNTHKTVELEDLSVFKTINQNCIDATPYIHDAKDLSILIQTIDNNSLSTSPKEIKGVLIGTKKEISSIRPILFLLGAHSKNYPALSLEGGLFNEIYLRNTKLPTLETRLDTQKEQMKRVLLGHKKLYVIYPQTDYEGNNYVNSTELEDWIQTENQFISLPEHSIYKKESFELSKEVLTPLFFNNNVLSVSRMETFSKCPLQHFLKYGLRLKEPKEITDVATRGTVLHSILEKSTTLHKKDYVSLQEDDIKEFVRDEFDFYLKVYPAKKSFVDVLIEDYSHTILLVLSQLKYFEDNWKMSFYDSEHKFKKEINWNGMTIELVGYVDRIDTSPTSFCIFDYKSSKKELEVKKFQSGLSLQLLTYTIAYKEEVSKNPVGCFYITFKAPYVDSKATKISYKKKEERVSVIDLENDDEFIQQNIINGWSFAGFEVYQEKNPQIKEKKEKLTVTQTEEQWPIIIQGILDDMAKGDIAPYHTLEACMYCKFERICRNAREEIAKQSYIEKEAE